MRLGQASGSLYDQCTMLRLADVEVLGIHYIEGWCWGICVDLEGAVIERFVGM